MPPGPQQPSAPAPPWVVPLQDPPAPPRGARWSRRDAAILADPPGTDRRFLTTPLPRPRRIGVVALKGGVGRTTVSILMAQTLVRFRPDPVLLVDADPTHGSFLLRAGVAASVCAPDLAAGGDRARHAAAQLDRTRDGVLVLPAGRDLAQSAAFDEPTYVGAMRAVHRSFPLMVTDCGAGLASALHHRVLTGCHSLVLATRPTIDGVLATHQALEWLGSAGFGELVGRTVVVLTGVPPREMRIDLQETRARLANECRAVAVLPFDDHLALGGYLDHDALAAPTRDAATGITALALQLAAQV